MSQSYTTTLTSSNTLPEYSFDLAFSNPFKTKFEVLLSSHLFLEHHEVLPPPPYYIGEFWPTGKGHPQRGAQPIYLFADVPPKQYFHVLLLNEFKKKKRKE